MQYRVGQETAELRKLTQRNAKYSSLKSRSPKVKKRGDQSSLVILFQPLPALCLSIRWNSKLLLTLRKECTFRCLKMNSMEVMRALLQISTTIICRDNISRETTSQMWALTPRLLTNSSRSSSTLSNSSWTFRIWTLKILRFSTRSVIHLQLAFWEKKSSQKRG
jgi:hypothetical protein